jgi:hypothetical protein
LIVGGIAIVTGYYRDVQRDEMDATLKMEMIQRGMSADEIAKVLETSSAPPDGDHACSNEARQHWRKSRRAMREARHGRA